MPYFSKFEIPVARKESERNEKSGNGIPLLPFPKSRGKARTFDRASSVGARWRTRRGKKEQFNAPLFRVFGTTLKLWQSRKHAERR